MHIFRRNELGLDVWLQQLLFLAADAYAASNEFLQVRALDAFSTCLLHSQHQQVCLSSHNDDVGLLFIYMLLSNVR